MRMLIVAVVMGLTTLPAALATEVFVLESGGQIEGELVNRDEKPRQRYVIKTSSGAQITLEKSQVKKVVRRRPEEAEYERIKDSYADTVEGQWALAEWCKQHRLVAQRKVHLRRILELDPEHLPARRALGYMRVEGKWLTEEEIMTSRGYVRVGSRWKLPQEIELEEQQRKAELAAKEWYGRLKRWRGWLDSASRSEQGWQEISQITDPAAIPAIAQYLGEEQDPRIRKLYIDVLAQINAPEGYRIMTLSSLNDPDQEVRLTCLDYLDNEPRPAVVEMYIKHLRHKDNAVVNRAAVGLARMKDPSAIPPLIDALVTTHKFLVDNTPAGQTTAGFGTGGGAFQFGGGPKYVSRKLQNPDVLDALVLLSDGMNFQYDSDAWKRWYASQKTNTAIDARRD
ncbi:MAG: HEAT repeat domain-containing protein [Pirellulales bacterium]|nr:HEAT repeat domain-containing protein [Pirellulales bacterium]